MIQNLSWEPINRVYALRKVMIMSIEVIVPDGVSGDWKIDSFTVTKEQARISSMRSAFSGGRGYVSEGNYKKLTHGNSLIMSNTPDEINDHYKFIWKAQESKTILINGLGLGMCVTAILKSDTVEKITIIEKSEDVIKLVAPTFKDDPRVEIIHADAFEYKPPKGIKYDAVWHDVWSYICGDNVKDMHKLHRKYGRRTDWQRSWCRSECERQNNRGSW